MMDTSPPASFVMPSTGQLYVISAPSGAGKTSLVKALLAARAQLVVSVSHTTRTARAHEIPGRDYSFVSIIEFERLVAEGAFLEHARVFDSSTAPAANKCGSRLGGGPRAGGDRLAGSAPGAPERGRLRLQISVCCRPRAQCSRGGRGARHRQRAVIARPAGGCARRHPPLPGIRVRRGQRRLRAGGGRGLRIIDGHGGAGGKRPQIKELLVALW